jgi:hypothetical protein
MTNACLQQVMQGNNPQKNWPPERFEVISYYMYTNAMAAGHYLA